MTRREDLIDKLADTMDRDGARAFVDEVIAEAIALRAAPRCDQCKLWTRHAMGSAFKRSEFGYCNVLSDAANIMSTRKDFGCVRWEAK